MESSIECELTANPISNSSVSSERQNADLKINLLKALIWLRLCEEYLVKLYPEQEMRTPIHFATGQEAIAAGVCKALETSDAVYSHHRCHNHFLAMGGTFFQLAAELYGRTTGCSMGRGGSVHLTSRDTGFIISSAILGETIAVATGSAFAFKMDHSKRVAVSFFGDGSCEEGSFYETLNFASLNKVPVLFVCENNFYSTESHISIRQPEGSSIHGRAQVLGIESKIIDGNDVYEVYETVKSILPKLRSGQGPFFLECMTYRWREHVGPNFDYEIQNRKYRSKEEQIDWMSNKCPIKLAADKLISAGIISESKVSEIYEHFNQEIQNDAIRAKESPWPSVDTLLNGV